MVTNKKVLIVHSRVNKHASRILKESESLIKSGTASRVDVLSMHYDENLSKQEKLDGQRTIYRLSVSTHKLPKNAIGDTIKFTEFFLRALIFAVRYKAKIIVPHSVAVLPFTVLVKFLTAAQLIYDAHELETEKAGLRGMRKKLTKLIERTFIPFVDQTVVVGDKIKEWYEDAYQLSNIHVVKNIPDINQDFTLRNDQSRNILKQELGLPDFTILFIYQGLFREGRGIELLIDVFSKLKSHNKHIVFMGFGELEEEIQSAAEQHPFIHYKAAVPPAQIRKYTSSADVGFSLIENAALSYYYSLPNKLFEYLHAGLPVIVSDFPEMGKVVETTQAGWRTPVNAPAVLQLVESINKEQLAEKQPKNIEQFYSWENEAQKMLSIYQLEMNKS